MTAPATLPSGYTMSVTETVQLSFDTTNELARFGASAPTNASVKLTNLGTGVTTTPTASPVISGNVIVQTISGPNDLASVSDSYLLIVNFTNAPTVNVSAMELVIVAGP